MRRIFFIAAMMISIAYGQTIPSIPGYTKINDKYNWLGGRFAMLTLPAYGDTSLQSNQARIAGAVLIDTTGSNKGMYVWYDGYWHRATLYQELSDTAAAIRASFPTGGGGGADSIFGKQDDVAGENRSFSVNGYTFAYKTGQLPAGSFLTHSWANSVASTFTTSLSTTTATVGSGKTNFNGGGLNLNNWIEYATYSGVNNYTISQTIVPQAKSNTSFGFGLAKINPYGVYEPFSHFMLSDTAGYIAYTRQTSLPTGASENNRYASSFVWSVGDTLDLKIIQRNRNITIRLTNRANGMTSELHTKDNWTLVGKWRIYFYGGSWDFLNNFTITYDENQSTLIGGTGDSIGWGLYAGNENFSWFNLISSGVYGGTVGMFGPGERTSDGILRMNDVVNFIKPKIHLIEYGANDFVAGVNIDSFSARISRMVDIDQANNIIPVIVGFVPKATDVTIWNDTLRAIATRKSIRFADVFAILKASGTYTWNSIYNSGDFVHPGVYGHAVYATVVDSALAPYYRTGFITKLSPLQVKGVPVLAYPYKYLSIDNEGNIAAAIPGGDSTNIWNRKSFEEDGISRKPPQAANMSIAGQAEMQSLIVTGTSNNYSAPVLKANPTDGVQITTGAVAGNFTFTTPGWQFAGTQLLVTSSHLRSTAYQAPWRFERAYPNSSTATGFIFNNDKTGGSAPSLFKLLSLQRDSIERAFFNKYWHYANPVTGEWNDSTLITKKYVDSLIAVVVGGGGGLTGVTDANGFDLSVSGGNVSASTNITSANRVVYTTGTSGAITSSANLTFDGTTLTVPGSTTAQAIKAGDLNLQTFTTNNSWIGSNVVFNGGFKAGVTGYVPMIYFLNGDIHFLTSSATTTAGAAATQTKRFKIGGDGRIASGADFTPTAFFHLRDGQAAANSAPLKFTSGTNLTTPEAGAMEYDGTNFYLSPSTTRKRIPLTNNGTPSNGQIMYGNGTDFSLGDHGNIAGLLDDDHTQYALLAGRAAGQSLVGGTTANTVLLLRGNNASSGNTASSPSVTFYVGDGVGVNAGYFANSGKFVTTKAEAKAIATINTSTTLDDSYYTVLVDASGGSVNAGLPAAASSAGLIYVIKKIDASGNSVVIEPNGAELVDGGTNIPLTTQYSGRVVQCDGTAWYVIGSF